MPTLDAIRANGERELMAKLRALDRDHQRIILEAIARYGSIQEIPQFVWQQLEREMEDEAAAAILLLLLASDEWTTREIQRQGLATVSATSGASVASYEAEARSQAQRMARETTDTLRSRLAANVEAQLPMLRTKTQAAAAADLRSAVEDVFSPGRRETIARTTVVNSSSAGQIGAGQRATELGQRLGAAGGDGAATGGGQRVRVKLIWTLHPERSQTGPCPICESVAGTDEETWGLRFPSGPGDETHPRCVCSLEPRVVVDGG